MKRDENDRLNDGTLPDDPGYDSPIVSREVPRVLTVQEITRAAAIRAQGGTTVVGCTTGIRRLDEITGGIKPGFVWCIGASTSWGKSSLLVMIADENIRRGKRVLIVSAEDSEAIYGDRLLLRRSRVSANALRAKKLNPDERAEVARVAEQAEDVPVFLDSRQHGVEWLAPRLKKLIVEHSIDLVAFDYLQAFDNQKAQQDRRNQVTYIARVLTDITKTVVPGGIAGIIFSQLTDSEHKKHPDRNSIRDSRDVSHAAEVVLLGFTPDKPIESQKWGTVDAGQRVLFADKVKDGPRGGLIPIGWDDHSACFDSDLDPPVDDLSVGFDDGINEREWHP